MPDTTTVITTPATTTPMSTVKSGIQTTEFALTIFVNVVTVGMTFANMLPAFWATIIMSVVTCVYTIMRTIVKNGDPAYNVPALPSSVIASASA